ncbi:hypothetical protein SAMN05444159_3271 [Bradyrhizobium lablabi]|uniref:Uncharacterized protein n=1 Tax=Bradyrhizobium lablabi TaxID=722472 RepID=A0A1M6SIF1_9BRAD|nr:hypothetical protein SAMN05444159_3271 [Bradyrhizobium lablabi]
MAEKKCEAPGEGEAPHALCFNIRGGSPSPQPSPREGRGEGAERVPARATEKEGYPFKNSPAL